MGTKRERGQPTMLDRLPPNTQEGEQALLGALLISNNAGGEIDLCTAELPAEAFYDLRHQTIYGTMATMHNAGLPTDTITIGMWLKDENLLDQCGGYAYLSTLEDACSSAAGWEYFRDQVHQKYVLRTIIKNCTEIVSQAYETGDFEISVIADRAGRELNRICEMLSEDTSKGMHDVVVEAITTIEQYHALQGELTGLATGFPDLDKMTLGLQNGEVFVLAGRPGNGKSALAMNIADHVAVELGLPVGVFSLEMSTKSLGVRLLCSRARVNIRNIQEGFMAERDFPRLTVAAGKLRPTGMRIDSQCGVSVSELRAKARVMHRIYGIRLFIIDYLQLLVSGKTNGSRQVEVSEMSGAIKRLSMELNVPILLLSQLNRSVEKEKGRKPRLSDLRESGSIEQDADTVGLLYRSDPYNPNRAQNPDDDDGDSSNFDCIPTNLDIAKQRNGPTGTIHLNFLRSYTRFESASKIEDDESSQDQQSSLPMD